MVGVADWLKQVTPESEVPLAMSKDHNLDLRSGHSCEFQPSVSTDRTPKNDPKMCEMANWHNCMPIMVICCYCSIFSLA